jgi:hypothetical protein
MRSADSLPTTSASSAGSLSPAKIPPSARSSHSWRLPGSTVMEPRGWKTPAVRGTSAVNMPLRSAHAVSSRTSEAG